MSTEEREPIKLESIPTMQWVMKPLPRPRIVRLLRRLLRAPRVPEHLRSAPAVPAPSLGTSAWQEVETRIGGVRLCVPPGLKADELSDLPSLDDLAAREILVGLWRAEGRSLAMWAGGKPEFPVGVHGMRQGPVMEERTESRESISGREVAISAFRVSLAGQVPRYEVLAYWPLNEGRWMRAAAQAETRGAQEEFLCALRTLRIHGEEWPGRRFGES